MLYSVKTIDHVQLAAPKGSEDVAKRFYAELLGFEVLEKPETLKKNGGIWFTFGEVEVHIGIEDPFHPTKKAHPAFSVEGLDTLKQRLEKHQVNFIEDDLLPGANRIYVWDPFGNRIEFLEWQNEKVKFN